MYLLFLLSIISLLLLIFPQILPHHFKSATWYTERISAVLAFFVSLLGIHATPEQLHFAGTFPISFAKEFHGKMFRDEELAFVYIYDQPVDITELILQKEEVEAVEWFDLEKTYEECK